MTTLGFIGLGNMGMPMAHNLLKAGYDVVGYNRSKEKEKTFEQLGGRAGLEFEELVQSSDVIMTCLPMPEDVEQVILGQNGVLDYAKEGALVIDFSTVSPTLHVRIERQAEMSGVMYLDAPISGGTTGAEAGTLAIMVGGREQTFEKAKPYFDVVGANVTHCGPIGQGTKVKLLNQYMVGLHTAAVGETLHMAEKSGLDRDLVYNVLSNGFGQSKIFDRHYKQFIAENKDEPGFALELLLKDLRLAEEMAKDADARLSAGPIVLDLFKAAEENGYGSKDMSALYQHVKDKE
ncbi:3-hydroxyisobutyrate dehydrogenase [Alteribacillus persepolensis]|uniref:3-hydroxyisobutyrate dehydrogenase n=1 Tax=Alteribacillus persepolensis TaxID=568899 RepID=A0A1G8EP67_9BACI|nr:NAD(P)-dependent oxidoreductase [Alteribacillus persepolensis]SDH71670.1 3-hydroxyisobutyrate dehydrogenase [Alteribacillus persepolensis]